LKVGEKKKIKKKRSKKRK